MISFGISTANANLINGSFETPRFTPGVADWTFYNEASVPGWQTTATDNRIELWSDSYAGVTPYEGDQFAELNAFQVSTLYQDASGISAGSMIGFEFAHRGRQGVDTMALVITDLGIGNVFGSADDSVLFTDTYSDGNTAWGFYTSAGIPIVAQGNTIRFEYQSISATGSNQAIGNFIDAAAFGVDVAAPAPVLVPASAFLLVPGMLIFGFLRRWQQGA